MQIQESTLYIYIHISKSRLFLQLLRVVNVKLYRHVTFMFTTPEQGSELQTQFRQVTVVCT
jgi:hypothetical protein